MFKMNKRGVMSLGMALSIVICIDAFMFMAQMSVIDISNEMGEGVASLFYNYNNSMISKVDKGNYTISTNSSIDDLIGTDSTVSPTTGDIFTDTFAKVKEWFVSKVPGLALLLGSLAGPYGICVMLHTPAWFSLAVGGIWFLLTGFLIVAFIAGRSE